MSSNVELPRSLDAERRLLGLALQAPGAYRETCGYVAAADFWSAPLGRLWAKIGEMTTEERPDVLLLDFLDLAGIERDPKAADRYGGVAEILSIAQGVLVTDDPKALAKRIRELAQRREAITRMMASAQALAAPGATPEAVTAAAASMSELMRGMVTEERRWRSIGEGMVGARDEALRARESGQPPERFRTGLWSLDEVFTARRQELCIIAARPGAGKSAFAQQWAEHVAVAHGATGFFQQEMTLLRMGGRALARRSNVASGRIQRGYDLMSRDEEAMEWAIQRYGRTPLYVDDCKGQRIETIWGQAEALKRTRPDLCMVVVDYLQLMEPPRVKGDTLAEALGVITRRLKIMAGQLDVCVVLLSQLNREGAEDAPQAHHLRGSGAIEQDADSILLLHRPNKESPVTNVLIAKQREGTSGVSIPMRFDGAYARFTPEKDQPGGDPWEERASGK